MSLRNIYKFPADGFLTIEKILAKEKKVKQEEILEISMEP